MDSSLQSIIAMGSELDRLVAEDQWNELNTLAQLRQQKLEAYFNQPLSVSDNQLNQSVIQQIMADDQERLILIKQKRQTVINESLQLKNSKHAIKQYRANDRG